MCTLLVTLLLVITCSTAHAGTLCPEAAAFYKDVSAGDPPSKEPPVTNQSCSAQIVYIELLNWCTAHWSPPAGRVFWQSQAIMECYGRVAEHYRIRRQPTKSELAPPKQRVSGKNTWRCPNTARWSMMDYDPKTQGVKVDLQRAGCTQLPEGIPLGPYGRQFDWKNVVWTAYAPIVNGSPLFIWSAEAS